MLFESKEPDSIECDFEENQCGYVTNTDLAYVWKRGDGNSNAANISGKKII